jgi:hypothetical protein
MIATAIFFSGRVADDADLSHPVGGWHWSLRFIPP